MSAISKQKTAILIFARSSKVETLHKKICNGGQLFDALTNNVLKTVRNTQLPYFHFSEEKQIGNTFGERFTNAILEVFSKGFEQIVTIGNDTPHLKTHHILETERQLSSNTNVLGPSIDGGFYLMGLHKSKFDKASFNKLDWQTSSVFKQLLHLFAHDNTTIFQLPALYDIDTQEDIAAVVHFTRELSDTLLRVLLNCIYTFEHGLFKLLYKLPVPSFKVLKNKGSPYLLSA